MTQARLCGLAMISKEHKFYGNINSFNIIQDFTEQKQRTKLQKFSQFLYFNKLLISTVVL